VNDVVLVLGHCWLGYTKGTRPVKTYASKPLGMAVSERGTYSLKYLVGADFQPVL